MCSSDLIAAKEHLEEAVDARKAASEDLLKQSPDHLSRTLSEAETEKGKALVKRQQAIAKVESADVSLDVLRGRITELEKKKDRLSERCESQRKEIEEINTSSVNAGIKLSELRSRAKHASEELGILSSRRDSIIEERSQARTEAQNKNTGVVR